MRVTENSYILNYLTNLNKGRERILDLQNRLATGRRVLKTSDDPQATDIILRLNASIERNERFQKNIEDAKAMMTVTGSILDSIVDRLIEVKEIVVSTTNESKDGMLNVYAERTDQLLREIMDMANTNFNGKFIFGGTQTLTRPYELAADGSAVTANPAGIDGKIEYPINEGVKQTANITGAEIFQGTDLFDTLIQLRDSLADGDPPQQGDLENINGMLDHVLGVASRAAAIAQSLEAQELHLLEQKIHLETLRSIQRDTDIAEGIMKLKHEEMMLEAALNVGGRILPKSLLDFLR